MSVDMAVLIAQAVEKAVQPFQERISSMEDTSILMKEKTAALEATQATLSDNQFIQLKLTNDLRDAAQNASQSAISAAASPGKKTTARIAKLKAILKARGGSQTFKKLQEDLDMSPSELTHLVGCLDKRSFEVTRRPGTKRGEKILSLRVRIMEQVVFK
jgi:hypothetical protein